MVVANTPRSHLPCPGPTTITFGTSRAGCTREDRINAWGKTPGNPVRARYTLWDHCFELPGKNLEASQAIAATVPVGTVTHKLRVASNDRLEIYDYPGGYAQRFDGDRPWRRRPPRRPPEHLPRTTRGPSGIRMQEQPPGRD